MEEEILIASSPLDAGIGCWDLQSGAELLRYKSCVSSPHGLTCVGNRFLASSQFRQPSKKDKVSPGSIYYWSWSKPQVEVKSFPEEGINPLVANSEGTYLFGGGVSGNIFLWEVPTGRLLKKWLAHYRGVTCLVLTEDDSLLVSASEDGTVKVWSLFGIFDEYSREQISHRYVHNFAGHTLRVNDVVTGYGGANAVVISASSDKTCKVWSLSRGILLRNIEFPSEIDAIALDPGEHVFYAGGKDGKIYIAALYADSSSAKSHWLHIIGTLSSHSNAVTCLAYGIHGNLLLAGSDDGVIRAWDPVKRITVRVIRHARGPVNNICVIRRSVGTTSSNVQISSRRRGPVLPPPLAKYVGPTNEVAMTYATVSLQAKFDESIGATFLSSQVLEDQIKEFQQKGSSATAELEVERLKLESSQSVQMLQKLMKLYDNLHDFCVTELLDGENIGGTDGTELKKM